MTTEQAQIEVDGRVHTFGDDGADSDQAPAVAAVVCQAPYCPNNGHHVQVHADTILPVICGGCGGVLHCEHQVKLLTHHEGFLGAPLKYEREVCELCGTEVSKKVTPVEPIPLDQVPIEAFGAGLDGIIAAVRGE